MTTATSASSTNYDPMYCLTEHLDYFSQSVAGKNELLAVDFDEIFGSTLPTEVPLVTSPVKTVTTSPPPSPKSVMSIPGGIKPLQLNREQAVVSPTTVASTAIFSKECQETASALAKVQLLPAPKVENTRSRKRKTSEPADSPPVNAEDKEENKRERNRQHAKRSRQRKREFMHSLEQSVQDLKEENAELFQLLGLSPQETGGMVQERENALDKTANEGFVEALKKPENRVLSDDALSSLRMFFN